MNRQLKQTLLKRLKPTLVQHQKVSQAAQVFVKRLEYAATELNLDCTFIIGGSFGKGTYLKGASDIDFFCKFSKKYTSDQLSILLDKIIKKAQIKRTKEKGSRDYYSGEFSYKSVSFSFEIVPVHNKTSTAKIENSTDASPFHVTYVKEQIKKKPSLADEIRLAKQFFKSQGLYGAESYINALSGYTVELLIIEHGSLQALLKSISTWGRDHVIDTKCHFSTLEKARSSLSKDKQSPLIIIDPVQKERNAARALSKENYGKLLFVAKGIDSLKASHFKQVKVDLTASLQRHKRFAKEKGMKLLTFKLKLTLNGESLDIVGSKLVRLHKKIRQYYEELGFEFSTSAYEFDMSNGEGLFVFYLEHTTLSLYKTIKGPEVTMTQALKAFKAKKKEVFVHGFQTFALEKRKVRTLDEATSKLTLTYVKKLFPRTLHFLKSFARAK